DTGMVTIVLVLGLLGYAWATRPRLAAAAPSRRAAPAARPGPPAAAPGPFGYDAQNYVGEWQDGWTVVIGGQRQPLNPGPDRGDDYVWHDRAAAERAYLA